jgi:hypothetical protein
MVLEGVFDDGDVSLDASEAVAHLKDDRAEKIGRELFACHRRIRCAKRRLASLRQYMAAGPRESKNYGVCAPFTCVSTAYRLVVPQM